MEYSCLQLNEFTVVMVKYFIPTICACKHSHLNTWCWVLFIAWLRRVFIKFAVKSIWNLTSSFANFSTVIVTNHSPCFLLFLFSSDNISPVSFVLRFYRIDDALQTAKLVYLFINCNRFTCRHLCGLKLWKNRYAWKF